MEKKKKIHGIIPQIALLFAIGVLTSGILTFFSQRSLSDENVRKEVEDLAREIAEETRLAISEFPACDWLVEYWYTHSDELDIEYDVIFGPNTRTEAKAREFTSRHPEIQMRYARQEELEPLPEEDQKLYAEVTYSWLITRINEIKRAHHVDYLFCVVTEEPYDKQFFLLSAAELGSIRGTNYEEVYPLGTQVEVGESQQSAMRLAVERTSHLADAGRYLDYYVYLGPVGSHSVLIGMTYNLEKIQRAIGAGTTRGTALAAAHQIILSAICLALLVIFVIRPLKKVQESIRLYKTTKDCDTVVQRLSEVTTANEIGQLAEDVEELTREIEDYVARIEIITAEEERLGTELALATRIQAAFVPHIFPPFPERSEFSLYASMDPAKEVGGDFYDFFLVDEDHLCVVMADVSGKGIPAALFMMASKIIIQSCAMLGRSPAEILTRTNEAICSNNQAEMFVTVWLGILEISTGRLTAANAGHECPTLKHPGGSFELIRDKHGLVVGAMDGVKYQEYELQLEPGSSLFIYTDGVPEATAAGNKLFGNGRMLAALNDSPDCAPEAVLHRVRAAVDDFVQEAEQFDDLTMLCLTYRGPEAQKEEKER